jgi:shikimate 5-dehydrogenase
MEERMREAGLFGLYQGSEMLTHQALEMLKRRTGLTKAQ